MSTWNFKEWWAKNKERQNAKRRKAYREDPVHRREVREAAQKNYRSRRRRMTPVDRLTIRDAKGNRYWSIGRVSRMINRTINEIRSYHKNGILPEPLAKDSRGWRLYTTNQAMLMRKVFQVLDDPNNPNVKSLADVSRIITPRWRD